MHIMHKSYLTPYAVLENGIANLIHINFSSDSENIPNKQKSITGFNLNTNNISIYFSKRRKHVDR